MGSNSRLAPNGYLIHRRDSLSGAEKPRERLHNILFMMTDVHLEKTQVDRVIKLFYEIEGSEGKGGGSDEKDNV